MALSSASAGKPGQTSAAVTPLTAGCRSAPSMAVEIAGRENSSLGLGSRYHDTEAISEFITCFSEAAKC